MYVSVFGYNLTVPTTSVPLKWNYLSFIIRTGIRVKLPGYRYRTFQSVPSSSKWPVNAIPCMARCILEAGEATSSSGCLFLRKPFFNFWLGKQQRRTCKLWQTASSDSLELSRLFNMLLNSEEGKNSERTTVYHIWVSHYFTNTKFYCIGTVLLTMFNPARSHKKRSLTSYNSIMVPLPVQNIVYRYIWKSLTYR
jgi:hypothetical protein